MPAKRVIPTRYGIAAPRFGVLLSFIFLRCHKTDFAFWWHMGENECRQSSFCPLLRTDDFRHPGGFQGRAEPTFGERPCLQGLVSYTFRRTADAKGGCGLWGSQLSCQPGRRIPRAAASGMLRPMKSGDNLTAVRSFPGRCAGRYIKPSSRRSDYAAPVSAYCFPRWYQSCPLLMAVFPQVIPKPHSCDITLLDHGDHDTKPSLR